MIIFGKEFNSFDSIALSDEDLLQIDTLITNALKNSKAGESLEILLLSDEELAQLDQKIAFERLKKLNTRLSQVVQMLHFIVEDNQVKIRVPHCNDEEKLRALFIGESEALLPIQHSQDILSRLSNAIITYLEGDLFIDALSDEQAACANNRLKSTDSKQENLTRFQENLAQLSQTNSLTIVYWVSKLGLTEPFYNFYIADERFTHLFPIPNRYRIQCSQQQVSELFNALKKCTTDSSLIPEQIVLSEILWKLKSHVYTLHGGGTSIRNKKYSISAANLVSKIERLLAIKVEAKGSSNQDFKQKAQTLLLDIRNELNHKRTPKIGHFFGWWGYRDETTIKLYKEILNIITPEQALLREILAKLQAHTYIINGFGKIVSGKRYPVSAGNIVEKIEKTLGKPTNHTNPAILKAEVQELCNDIIQELLGKTSPTKGSCFHLGGRDQSTANLYLEILNICKSTCNTTQSTLS